MSKNGIIKISGAIIGAILGFAYHYYWGCTSGCAIRSSSKLMTIYGGLMGFLFVGLFEKSKEEG